MIAKRKLLDTWTAAVATMHIGHHLAAASCTKWHLVIGGFATLLAAAVSAAVFAKISGNVKPDSYEYWALACVGVLSPALTAAVTFLRLDERALRHTRAASSFGDLRRQLELKAAVVDDNSSNDLDAFLKEHLQKWREVIKDSPPLPSRAWKRAKIQRDEELDRQKQKRSSREESVWHRLIGIAPQKHSSPVAALAQGDLSRNGASDLPAHDVLSSPSRNGAAAVLNEEAVAPEKGR
jgi:hypothetical protein